MTVSMSGYSPLPTRSPMIHPPGTSKTSPNSHPVAAWLPFLRARIVPLVTAGTVIIILIVLTVTSHLPNAIRRVQYGLTPGLAYTSRGLNTTLWKQLHARTMREFIVEPVEISWTKPSEPADAVPWTTDDLIPTTKENLAQHGRRPSRIAPPSSRAKYVRGEHVPRHQIEAFPLVAELPPSAPHGKDLLFGITTTSARAKIMSEFWTRWMVTEDDDDRPGCMILLSEKELPEDVESLRAVLTARGLDCGVTTSSEPRYEVRVMSMVKELPEYAERIRRSFKWFVFNDDDTYWLDPRMLHRMLAKYDSTEMHFIGARSEAEEAQWFGRMAFGGAGILASSPIVLGMRQRWPECHEQFKLIFGGDEMLTRCAALASGKEKETVMTEEIGPRQFDIPGDATGILQSGMSFMTLHHYMTNSWVRLFGDGSPHSELDQIRILGRVVKFLGGDNLFKRYVFGDGHWLLTNGYSITYFDEALTRENLKVVEHTWFEEYRLVLPSRNATEERHGGDEKSKSFKQTYYIDSIDVLGPKKAVLTYLQAGKWDENLRDWERVRIKVLWDGCWNGGQGCETVERQRQLA